MVLAADVLARSNLPFLQSSLEFQRIFPVGAAYAACLAKVRWSDAFACPRYEVVRDAFRLEARAGVLRCRA
jgi:hypothetical protein